MARPVALAAAATLGQDSPYAPRMRDSEQPISYLSAGTSLAAWASGKGMPFVLLHGSGLQDHTSFAPWVKALAGEVRIYACDARGFGRSVSREASSHTWNQYADDVAALLDHLQLSAAVVGGVSFGAGVALATALRHPARVKGLVLAEPAYAGARVGHTAVQEHVWAAGRAVVRRARRDGLLAAMMPADASVAWAEEIMGAVKRHDEESFVAAHEGELQTAHPFETLQQLTAVIVRTLILPGSDDAHDAQIATWYAAHMPNATVGPDARAEPALVMDAVRRFLATC